MAAIDPPTQGVHEVLITPDIARHWLTFNTHNRPRRPRAISAYAVDIGNNDWQWNGEPIKFSGSGTSADPFVLQDGQNRLYAIIEADTSVKMLVVGGLAGTAQDTMDGGVKRRFADVLSLRGETHAYALAAVTRRVHLWEENVRSFRGGGAPSITNAQLIQTLNRHPQLRDIAAEADRLQRHCPLPASIIGLGLWLFEQIDAEDCRFFFDRLADWQGLVKGDPIYELRRAADNSRNARGARNDRYLTALLIKAWNAYRAGEEVGQLRFRPGGANPERFPEPK